MERIVYDRTEKSAVPESGNRAMEEDDLNGSRPCGRLFCYVLYFSVIFRITLALNQPVTFWEVYSFFC
jgi:hypothetical protein